MLLAKGLELSLHPKIYVKFFLNGRFDLIEQYLARLDTPQMLTMNNIVTIIRNLARQRGRGVLLFDRDTGLEHPIFQRLLRRVYTTDTDENPLVTVLRQWWQRPDMRPIFHRVYDIIAETLTLEMDYTLPVSEREDIQTMRRHAGYTEPSDLITYFRNRYRFLSETEFRRQRIRG
jgi:hypothetical protein